MFFGRIQCDVNNFSTALPNRILEIHSLDGDQTALESLRRGGVDVAACRLLGNDGNVCDDLQLVFFK